MNPDGGVRLMDTGTPSVIDAPTARPDTPPLVTVDAPPPRPDTPAPRPDGGSRVCAPSCTTDSQCATSCPANPLGANCCDTTMGRCYAATMAVCPVGPGTDGGTSMY